MPEFKFVRVVTWPRKQTPAASRRRAPFSAGHNRTLQDLGREIVHLGARQIVIQTHHDESQLRRDGMPRSDARDPVFPGVILTFTTSKGDFSYPCDTFDDWRANLRAIVLTLERLRAIDRYGVTALGQQYTGFKALPPAPMEITREHAAKVLAEPSGFTVGEILAGDTAVIDRVWRAAALKLHPDHGGSHELFVEAQRAAHVLWGTGA